MYNIVEIVNDLEIDIKKLIKDALFDVSKAERLMKDITKLIDKELSVVSKQDVRNNTKKNLQKYAMKEWKQMVKQYHLGVHMLLLGIATPSKKVETQQQKTALQKAVTNKRSNINIVDYNKGLSNLANSHPTTKEAHIPLDSQVEMYKRHIDQEEMVDRLKQVTDLVIVSSHANCSPRCAMWQGKVLSLSGKTGKTEDGKKIYPLTQATDVYVTTKKGKVWKNGLLGFNCRHKLIPYKTGMRQPVVSETQRKREYAIDIQQRELERQIRSEKSKAILLEGKEAQHARLKARQLTQHYERFCVSNGRPVYQSRIVL